MDSYHALIADQATPTRRSLRSIPRRRSHTVVGPMMRQCATIVGFAFVFTMAACSNDLSRSEAEKAIAPKVPATIPDSYSIPIRQSDIARTEQDSTAYRVLTQVKLLVTDTTPPAPKCVVSYSTGAGLPCAHRELYYTWGSRVPVGVKLEQPLTPNYPAAVATLHHRPDSVATFKVMVMDGQNTKYPDDRYDFGYLYILRATSVFDGVTGITKVGDNASDNEREVEFTYHYEPTALGKELEEAGLPYPRYAPGPRKGTADFKKYDDGWRIENIQWYIHWGEPSRNSQPSQ